MHNEKLRYGAFKYILEAETINGEKINKKGRICVNGNSDGCKECNCIEDYTDCKYGDQFEKGIITYHLGEGKPFKCD